MRAVTLTTWNENMHAAEQGDHKGRLYDMPVGAYFRSNRSCQLSPTPPIMKKGAERRMGNHKGCPYERFAGGYFQRNDRETEPDRSYKSVLLTPVSPLGERCGEGVFAI